MWDAGQDPPSPTFLRVTMIDREPLVEEMRVVALQSPVGAKGPMDTTKAAEFRCAPPSLSPRRYSPGASGGRNCTYTGTIGFAGVELGR